MKKTAVRKHQRTDRHQPDRVHGGPGQRQRRHQHHHRHCEHAPRNPQIEGSAASLRQEDRKDDVAGEPRSDDDVNDVLNGELGELLGQKSENKIIEHNDQDVEKKADQNAEVSGSRKVAQGVDDAIGLARVCLESALVCRLRWLSCATFDDALQIGHGVPQLVPREPVDRRDPGDGLPELDCSLLLEQIRGRLRESEHQEQIVDQVAREIDTDDVPVVAQVQRHPGA